jgi:hypothetical protein
LADNSAQTPVALAAGLLKILTVSNGSNNARLLYLTIKTPK